MSKGEMMAALFESFLIHLFISVGEILVKKGFASVETWLKIQADIKAAREYQSKVNEGVSREERKKAEDDFFSR